MHSDSHIKPDEKINNNREKKESKQHISTYEKNSVFKHLFLEMLTVNIYGRFVFKLTNFGKNPSRFKIIQYNTYIDNPE